MENKKKRDVSEFCHYIPDEDRFQQWYERTTFIINLMKEKEQDQEQEARD